MTNTPLPIRLNQGERRDDRKTDQPCRPTDLAIGQLPEDWQGGLCCPRHRTHSRQYTDHFCGGYHLAILLDKRNCMVRVESPNTHGHIFHDSLEIPLGQTASGTRPGRPICLCGIRIASDMVPLSVFHRGEEAMSLLESIVLDLNQLETVGKIALATLLTLFTCTIVIIVSIQQSERRLRRLLQQQWVVGDDGLPQKRPGE